MPTPLRCSVLVSLATLAIAGCAGAADPATGPADTVAVAEGALAGVRFDVRRDPG